MRKKKYFDGGVQYNAGSALTSGLGTVTGAASGDFSGLMNTYMNNAKQTTDIMNSNLSGGAKAGSIAGQLIGGPVLGGVINNLIGQKLQEQRDASAQDSAAMQQRNQMIGLADGGYLSPSQYSQQMQGRTFEYLPPMQGVTPTVPQKEWNPDSNLKNIGNTDLLTQFWNRGFSHQYDGTPTSPPRDPRNSPRFDLEKAGKAIQEQKHNIQMKNWLGDMTHRILVENPNAHKLSSDEINNMIKSLMYHGAVDPNGFPLTPENPNPKQDFNFDNFTNGGMLNYYDGGFKHNDPNPENVHEGIPQGYTPDGNVNTVEFGEVSRDMGDGNKKVFSNNPELKVTKKMATIFNLPKNYIGKTFAQNAKNINKESIERPNDNFTKATVSKNLDKLFNVNLYAKQQQEAITFAKNGGYIQHDNGDWMHTINPYNDPNYQTQTPMLDQGWVESPMSPNLNYADINNYAQSLGLTREEAVNNLINNPNWRQDAYKSGYSSGRMGVPWQHTDPSGFAGGINAGDIWQTNPELVNYVFKGTKKPGDNFNPQELKQLQTAITSDPELRKQYNFTNDVELDASKPFGWDWLTSMNANPSYYGSDYMETGGGEGELVTDVPNKPPTKTPPETPPTPPDTLVPGKSKTQSFGLPNLWPEAGMLSALPYLGLKPNLADPTLMSTGYLKPQLVDEMSMRAGVDSANRANVGALANATGGSNAAQRAGLLGAGSNYMDATGNAFMQANQANNQARMAADQFNIQNQTGVAGQNMQALNQFELENKELINNINAKKADEFANTIGNYVQNRGQIRAAKDLENTRADYIKQFTGYDPLSGKRYNQFSYTQNTPGFFISGDPMKPMNTPKDLPYNTVQNPVNSMMQNDMNNILKDSKLNKPMQSGLFDLGSAYNTMNTKITRPEFCNGGKMRTKRRSLK